MYCSLVFNFLLTLYILYLTLILYFSTGKLDPDYVPDLRLTSPVFKIGPYPSWSDPKKISGTVYLMVNII